MTLHVAISPITGRIYCGSVLKDGMTWASNKTDVTGQACAAVAQHAIAAGIPVVVSANGKPRWEITVRELSAEECPDSNRGESQDGIATRHESAQTMAHGSSASGVTTHLPSNAAVKPRSEAESA